MPYDNVLSYSCSHCGMLNNLTNSTGPRKSPRDGDASVCFGCGTIYYFRADEGKFCVANDAELNLLRTREGTDVLFQLSELAKKGDLARKRMN